MMSLPVVWKDVCPRRLTVLKGWLKVCILFYFILFYFILFYFILFYFILFYFILFYYVVFAALLCFVPLFWRGAKMLSGLATPISTTQLGITVTSP